MNTAVPNTQPASPAAPEEAEHPAVSVVLPVYNTGPYLEETVRTLLAQTLHEIEIVAIDDGSTDESGQTLARLAAEDPRIRLFRQENQGLSAARNRALEEVRGKYVLFMDSDDLLEPDTLACCYRRAEAEDLDVVYFDAESFGSEEAKQEWNRYRRVSQVGSEAMPGSEAFLRMVDRDCYRSSACMSIVRFDLLQRTGLRFYRGIIHEDELFTPQLLAAARRVAGIDRIFYRRRLRPGSIMKTTFGPRNVEGYLTVMRELHRFAEGCGPALKAGIHRRIGEMLEVVMFRSAILPWPLRRRIAAAALRCYPRLIRPRAFALLLFKKMLKRR